MNVADLMTEDVRTVGPEDTLLDVYDVMSELNVRHVPVVDDGELVGLVSHRDLLKGALGDVGDMPVTTQRNFLATQPVDVAMMRGAESVGPDTSLQEAASLMLENKFGCLPVTEGSRLVGILTEADFVRLVAQGD